MNSLQHLRHLCGIPVMISRHRLASYELLSRLPSILNNDMASKHLCTSTISMNMKKKQPLSSSFVAKPVDIKKKQIILLDSEDEPIGVMTKQQAQRRANEEELKLVLVQQKEPNEENLPTYKLLSGKELHELRMQAKEEKTESKKKSQKQMRIKSKITDHDLQIKLKHISEILEKGHDIRISIRDNSLMSDKEINKVFDQITDSMKNLATIQQAKKSHTEFTIVLKSKLEETLPENMSTGSSIKPLKFQEMKEQLKQNKSPGSKS